MKSFIAALVTQSILLAILLLAIVTDSATPGASDAAFATGVCIFCMFGWLPSAIAESEGKR